MAMIAIAGIFIVTVVGGIGFGVASAGSVDEVANNGAFGLDETTTSATLARRMPTVEVAVPETVSEQSLLESPSERRLDSGYQMVDDMERAERERIEAENAAAIQRMEAEKAKQGVVSSTAEDSSDDGDYNSEGDEAYGDDYDPEADAIEYSLPAVDWTVGREAFIEEWTIRIDAYLAGSPLEGYGYVFAEAAWDNGVDPRWSPAISNTESCKGEVCFRSYNAWGWGSASWSDWETAIRDHVAGLAAGYGYSITLDAAATYCPPTYVDWYNKTLEQMALI